MGSAPAVSGSGGGVGGAAALAAYTAEVEAAKANIRELEVGRYGSVLIRS